MFDLCCNRGFMSRIKKASCALNMTRNCSGLKITGQGKFPGYKFLVWFSKQAITNITCLKNLIKIYRVTYDSKIGTTFVSSITNSLVSLTYSSKCTRVVCTSAIQRIWVSLDSSRQSKTLCNFLASADCRFYLSKGFVQKDDFPIHCQFQGNCQCRRHPG